jgi:hypothetical protein
MSGIASKPIIVTSKVYAKIKEWADAGRVVNHFLCQDLSCLTTYFSPNPECCCPNHAWACPGKIEAADVKLADLKVEAVVAQPVAFKDLVIYWRESNQMSIVLEIPGHWRPIKAVSFGYIGGIMGMDRATRAEIKREHGQKKPTKWLKAAREDGSLEDILNRFGYTLNAEPKVLEA